MFISAAVEGHMCKSLIQLMKIALLLTAIDAALVLFPVTAHAGTDVRRPMDAGADGAQRVAVLVTIDKSTQRMTVSVNGVERYEWPVSTGRAGYSTPSGTFTATSMNEIWYSKQWDNSPMPHAIFFINDGHAIHGSYEVKNLGRPASHGCVRIAPKNAAILYALVAENGLQNTRVVLTGITPGGEYNDAEDESPRGEYYDAEDETNPRGEYRAARTQTYPRRVYVGRSSSVPYYYGSQGYYRNYYGSQGYGSQGNASPLPWFIPHW